MIKVLFVCLGNICRSPTAEAIFEGLVKKANLQKTIIIDSAGICDDFVDCAPDRRAQETAQKHGIIMQHYLGRQVSQQDFEDFDYIIAMDKANVMDLKHLCPRKHQKKISLLLSHGDSDSGTGFSQEIPDPYFGGPDQFDRVFELISEGVAALLESLCKAHGLFEG